MDELEAMRIERDQRRQGCTAGDGDDGSGGVATRQ
jgi:hypothetical protein